MAGTKPKKRCHRNDGAEAICSHIREEILPILYQTGKSDDRRYHNSHAVFCWMVKECSKTDCPAYGQTDIACWYRVGTYCDGVIQGSFVEKCGECRRCEVFKQSCPSMVEELGEAVNFLLASWQQEKKDSTTYLEKIKDLNQDLVASLEILAARNSEIQQLLITDKLTGIYNRNHLFTVLDDEIIRVQRSKSPLTALMIDLDNFKTINDTYGHSSGDMVLSSFGAILRRTIRKCDRSFRYGGEEFVVLFPDTNVSGALILAERIRNTTAAEPVVVHADNKEQHIPLTVSIGLAPYVMGITAYTLLAQADEAMYKAKSKGKNRVMGYGVD